MAGPSRLRHYVETLINDLESIGVTPPPDFRQAFMREARHLGTESIEDFGSMYLLECLKAKRECPDNAEVASLTTLNTVRRRLVRQAQQAHPLIKEAESSGNWDPSEIAAFADTLELLLSRLDVREKILLDGILQGKTLKESAPEAGMSHDSARQAFSRLRKKVGPWLARLSDPSKS